MALVERGGELSIRRQCALLGINRSSVYYTPREERAENLALMRRMDELSLQYPFYGSRQMARHLGREGVSVGRRRVRRLMRLMGLEAVYRKPRTSAAQPGHRIYPYLLRELTIERPDQVWCADITYIPVTAGFLYLVAVMDWASRHVLAWRLSNTMDTVFCIEALEAALRTGTPEIFNTDQGAQFTSAAFTERVLAAGARCSMDGRGRCLDNVFIERLWRSLKYEAVYLHELADGFEAERVIGTWMTFYSDVRPHSALGGSHAGRGLRRGACSVNMSAACSALDALDRRMVQVTPLGIQGEGCRLGEKTHRVLDRRPGADSPAVRRHCQRPVAVTLRCYKEREASEGGPLRAPHVRHRAGAQRARPRPRTRSARHRRSRARFRTEDAQQREERGRRSLKYEAVYPYELVDGFEAERVIGTWMTFYSDVRPHSALGGRTPAEAYGEERAA